MESINLEKLLLEKDQLPINISSLSKEDEFGINLVSLNENYRREYEPESPSYLERLNILKEFSSNGFKTFINLDNYPAPNKIHQDFNEILDTISFVDKIILNKNSLNGIGKYKKFYEDLETMIINFCNNNYIKYSIV